MTGLGGEAPPLSSDGAEEIRVSVVIPFHDARATLVEAVTAVLRSRDSNPAVEVVLVDNRSTDGSGDLAAELAGRHQWVRVVAAPEAPGAAVARNVGAAHARGRLLAFTDADDIVSPSWVGGLLEAEARGVRFATGRMSRFSTGDAPDFERTFSGSLRHMGGPPYADGSCFIVERELFLRLGGFDESLRTGEDVDLSWRLGADVDLEVLPGCVVASRLKPGGVARLRQHHFYGRGDVALWIRHGGALAHREPPWTLVRVYAGLVLRLPLLWDRRQRHRWLQQLGRRSGRLAASVRHRVWLP